MVAFPEHGEVAPLNVDTQHREDRQRNQNLKTTRDEALGKQGVLRHYPPDFWDGSRWPIWLQTFVTNVFVFIIVHYTFWFVPALGIVAWMSRTGHAWAAIAVVALYVPSFLDGAHRSGQGKQWDAFRALRVWNLIAANYLRMKMIREAPLDTTKTKQYVFAYHPHGLLVVSRFALFGGNWEALFPNVDFRFLGASSIFSVPLCREASLWLGAVDASRSTAERVLAAGKSITVYPGGIREMFCLDPHAKETRLVLKNQRGFIKLAMRHGAELVPVVVFNERWLYHVWRPNQRFADMVRRTLGVPLIAFWGRFLWMPFVSPPGKTFGMVFGTPITANHTLEPTDEDVEALQSLYIKEVQRLFTQYKADFGCDADETLVIE